MVNNGPKLSTMVQKGPKPCSDKEEINDVKNGSQAEIAENGIYHFCISVFETQIYLF